jgi:hypothetical protein
MIRRDNNHLTTQPISGVVDRPQDLMTVRETIAYLRLDVDQRDPKERLRNLVRRQRLPEIKRGKLRLYRRAAIDAWLEVTR